MPGQRFTVVGQSYGGYLARGVLARWVTSIDGMALICPVAFWIARATAWRSSSAACLPNSPKNGWTELPRPLHPCPGDDAPGAMAIRRFKSFILQALFAALGPVNDWTYASLRKMSTGLHTA
jgi:hypothetical protein